MTAAPSSAMASMAGWCIRHARLVIGGDMTVGAGLTGWALIADRLRHLVLPALALASFFVAVYARLTRASMLEVQRQDFMRTAQAKGLHPFLIQLRLFKLLKIVAALARRCGLMEVVPAHSLGGAFAL